jgi:hypothetical protein
MFDENIVMFWPLIFPILIVAGIIFAYVQYKKKLERFENYAMSHGIKFDKKSTSEQYLLLKKFNKYSSNTYNFILSMPKSGYQIMVGTHNYASGAGKSRHNYSESFVYAKLKSECSDFSINYVSFKFNLFGNLFSSKIPKLKFLDFEHVTKKYVVKSESLEMKSKLLPLIKLIDSRKDKKYNVEVKDDEFFFYFSNKTFKLEQYDLFIQEAIEFLHQFDKKSNSQNDF